VIRVYIHPFGSAIPGCDEFFPNTIPYGSALQRCAVTSFHVVPIDRIGVITRGDQLVKLRPGQLDSSGHSGCKFSSCRSAQCVQVGTLPMIGCLTSPAAGRTQAANHMHGSALLIGSPPSA
jgi:hypothetical protein